MIRIFDDEKLKENPCDKCSAHGNQCDVYGMDRTCNELWAYKGQQSILAISKDAKWLDKMADEWFWSAKPTGNPKLKKINLFSQFIQEKLNE